MPKRRSGLAGTFRARRLLHARARAIVARVKQLRGPTGLLETTFIGDGKHARRSRTARADGVELSPFACEHSGGAPSRGALVQPRGAVR